MRRQAGFTLVELIIAMAIFAAALSIITLSFTGLVRIQRTAASDRATLENGRQIIDDMVNDIRSATSVEVCSASTYHFAGVTGDSLLVNGATPVIYFEDSNKVLRKWDVSAGGGCTAPSLSAPPQTSNGVTVNKLVLLIVDYGTGKSTSADIDLTLKGQGNVLDHIHTAATTRGGGG